MRAHWPLIKALSGRFPKIMKVGAGGLVLANRLCRSKQAHGQSLES
jgi:hypothetical protein